MKQIVINFVSNALKFTPVNGKIDILINIKEIQVKKNKERFINFEIIFKDSGVGISQEGID